MKKCIVFRIINVGTRERCAIFAVFVNTAAIVLGALIGLLLRRGLPERLSAVVMQALGLCTVVIGVQGMVGEEHILLMILSLVIGAFIGTAMDWDGHVNRFAERMTARFAGAGDSAKMANAFVTSCLIMNVGAMVIVGSLDAGLRADFTMLYTKSMLDFVSGIMLAAAMGIGVMGSAVFTLIVQGFIVLTAEWAAPLFSPVLIAELSATGSVLILAIGLNMLELTKIKVLDYIPALAVLPVLLWLQGLFL